MKINYDILALLLLNMEPSKHITFKTKNNINGHSRKLVAYKDHTFYEDDPSIDYDNIMISNMSTRELNELKKTLLSRGFSERSGGGV